MTTPTELKETITKQYNETLNTLIRLEGALAALNELEKEPALGLSVEPEAEAE